MLNSSRHFFCLFFVFFLNIKIYSSKEIEKYNIEIINNVDNNLYGSLKENLDKIIKENKVENINFAYSYVKNDEELLNLLQQKINSYNIIFFPIETKENTGDLLKKIENGLLVRYIENNLNNNIENDIEIKINYHYYFWYFVFITNEVSDDNDLDPDTKGKFLLTELKWRKICVASDAIITRFFEPIKRKDVGSVIEYILKNKIEKEKKEEDKKVIKKDVCFCSCC